MTPDDRSFEDPLDPALRDAARAYHEPPTAVPREAMWGAIQARRRQIRPLAVESPRADQARLAVSRRGWLLSLAASVVLATGIALGWAVHERIGGLRQPGGVGEVPIAGGQTTGSGGGLAYQIAVTSDLTQVEALLAAYRSTPNASRRAADAQLANWARDILLNTRLLLDSRAAADPQRRRLLEDLELVLVQMVELAPGHTDTDRQMIDQTLDRNHVMTRLRAAVPAGGTGT